MTTGIISQLARLIPNPDTGYSIANTIRTNAVVNPGKKLKITAKNSNK